MIHLMFACIVFVAFFSLFGQALWSMLRALASFTAFLVMVGSGFGALWLIGEGLKYASLHHYEGAIIPAIFTAQLIIVGLVFLRCRGGRRDAVGQNVISNA